MTTRRICVVTGSRADYGLLVPPMRAIQAAPDLKLQIAVTGMHLERQFGLTVQAIEQDGFLIDGRVDMHLSCDSDAGIGRSIGLGVAGFADYFAAASPDLVMLLGDRFEMLAAAAAALVAGLPVAHLCGGDVTEGAYDDSIRHALTKMAHIHFVTNEEARRRVIQLGEQPDRVHLVGSPGLDYIRTFSPLARKETARRLDVNPQRPWLLITFHPVTRDPRPSVAQLDDLLGALDAMLARRFSIIITQPNADNEGRALTARLQDWVSENSDARLFPSLGQDLYLSAMSHAAAIVGNSSSGLYEAPSFGRATINIGSRQDGRPRATSVIDCPPQKDLIGGAIDQALAIDAADTVNPYGDGHASERIVAAIRAVKDFRTLLVKPFHDLRNRP